ncbi:MAG: SGNH/GDSL hydrolase family protein, partial [Clostridia bacterium]|nr:SGNH/GDSL hydrolase family protein [Clostridia bacterium]
MKRRTTALFLAVAFLISCISFTGFAEEADNLVYLQDYSQEQLEQGQSYREYFYSNTGSSWNLNAAGSWAVEWLVNDSHSKDGNYFVIAPASQNIYLLTIAPTQGGNGRLSMKKSFLFEFSFNSLKSSPNNPEENNRVPGTMEVRIFPEKSTTSNGRSGEGLILTIPVGGDITFVDDTAEKTAEKFATEQNTWYDVKIAADLSTAVPTYSAWIKKSADSDYTLLTEGASFPRSGDYSEGLGVFGLLNVKAVSGSAMAVDDMKITYDVKKVPPSAKAVFASGSGSVGKTLYGMYEFNGSPGEGDSRYEWLVCDSEEGDYQPLSGQNSRTLSLDQSLNNRYVKFQVTPVNQDGEQGEAVQSPTVRIRESDREYGLDQLNNDPGELKIAFLGGSITYGTGASKMENRYSTQLVYNYFKTNFFNKTVTEINSGIGGTPSDLGLMRLNREISSRAPDVVFVEYAVNDGHFDKATTQRQNEGIIRQLLELPKQPVVIPLYTCRDGLDETTADYQKEVAQYYGLGSVSFLDYLKENGGNEAWSKLTTDGVHPNDAGHAKYSEIAIEAFQNDFPRFFKTYSVPEEVMSDHEFRNTTLVPYNEKDRVAYTGNFEINPSDTQKDSFSGFTHWPNGSITSRTIGDQVTFTFRGSTIGLWAMRGTKYGKVSYDIDNGAYTGVIDTNSSYTMAYPVFFRCDLEGGEHTLVLENAGGGTDNLFTYAYFVTDDDFAPKPHCENVRIVGPMRLGGTVQAEFDYDGSQEECSYRWLYYDEEKGSYQPIPGATEQSWKITSAYGDRLVRVEVTAKDGNTSQSPEVRIPGTTETVLYSQTYEQRPLGVTAPTATWSSWCHNMAGSYAYVYLLNDDYSV